MDLTPRTFDAGDALWTWLAVFGTLAALVLAAGLLASLLSGGTGAVGRFARGIWGTLKDLVLVSPGRVFAVAQLTWREALRRRALYVFGLFAVLFMFAGWFLSDAGSRPADQVKVYVSFVLTVVSWLTLLVMLLLSCWGVPEDIRRRSLHTVVTKPARRSEVVLGRMAGYTLIGTVILAVMGAVGYGWIVRQAGDARDALTARRPLLGDVRFYGRDGAPAAQGLNVGNVWEYRGYIDGASRMKAVFSYDGVDESLTREVLLESPDGSTERGRVLQFESDFEGFRTVKGDMSRGLLIQYTYVNPQTGLAVADPAVFSLEEFDGNVHNVPTELLAYDEDAGEERVYDFFDELVSDDGRLEVEVRSLDPQQLLGVGRADLFVRPPDGPFWTSYAASVAAIWLKMALLVALGVTAGTFVKGPVATLLVFTLLIVGQTFQGFMGDLLEGNYLNPGGLEGVGGGGPVEATFRILTHANTIKDLPPGPVTSFIEGVDQVLLTVLWAFSQLIPDLSAFDTAARTAAGFSVPVADHLLPAAAVTLGFLIPCYFVGTLSLRSRELEAK